MANFTVSSGVSVSTSDPFSLSRTITNLGLNGKHVIDDVFPIGALDLAPLLASIGKPRIVMIVADDISGCTVNLDGVGASTLKAKTVYLEITTDIAPDIEIVLTVAQRVRVVAVGDPD